MTPENEMKLTAFEAKIEKLKMTPRTLELREETLDEAKQRADQNQELLEMINDANATCIYYIAFRKNGDIEKIYFSENFKRMFAIGMEAVSGGTLRYFADLVHPDERNGAVAAFLAGISGKADFNMKHRIRIGNGYEWFHASGMCRKYKDGSPRLFLGTFTNITSEEQDNSDLFGRLEAMIGGVNGGIMISKMEEGFPYEHISESVAALQGYTPAELKAVTKGLITNNIWHEDAKRVSDYVMELLGKGSNNINLTYRVRHKDGRLIWVNDFGKIVHMPDGTVKVYSLLQDVTERKMAQERLDQERAQYREALAQNAICIFAFDLSDGMLREDIILEDGTSLVKMLGCTLPTDVQKLAEEYLGSGEVTVGRRASWLFSLEALRKMHSEGKNGEIAEFYETKLDRYVRIQALMFTDIFTGHQMCRYICTDNTRQKKAEDNQRKALLEAMQQAKDANRAKTVFLSNMSHDIRTPMNAIMGYTNLAESHIDDREKTLDYLKKIQISGDHLLQLINDVLDMSRIETGRLTLEEAVVDFEGNIDSLLSITEPGAREKHISIEKEMRIKNNDVYFDQLRVNQVLINCLGNAVKFTPDGGKIKIYVEQKECDKSGFGEYEIKISDTGIGMSQEFLEHIFEPFSRERNTTVSGIQGTGLGMAITKNILDLMGGSIDVASEKGKGTEFTINLMLRLADENDMRITGEDDKVYTEAPGVKALLVEDNEINREIATEILKEGGVIVTAAMDGSEALDIMKNSKVGDIDIILMDVQMPGMNGFEATKIIRGLPDDYQKNIPIVAMTANAFEEDKRAAIEAGMNAHLAKPIVVSELWRTVCTILKK